MQSSPPTPDPEPDLDVDSDNSNWPGGWPDRSQYEDDIEDISGDPQYPGKFIMVNDNDDDGDGIPDFADGFNWDEQSGNDDDANWYESDLVPIVLELPDAIDLSAAKLYIVYESCPPGSSDGSLRLWKSWPTLPRNPAYCGSYGGGDYVGPARYSPSELGFNDTWRIVTLFVEALGPSSDLADQVITVYLDPDGTHGYYPYYWPSLDTVRLTAVRIDLDVDSDNTNGFDAPARTDCEDQIEDAASKPDLPGKFVQVNDNDDDGDGIPDFADGFNWDQQSGNDDDANWYESDLVPIVLELPDAIDLAPWGQVLISD
jgi:hypothetical protein